MCFSMSAAVSKDGNKASSVYCLFHMQHSIICCVIYSFLFIYLLLFMTRFLHYFFVKKNCDYLLFCDEIAVFIVINFNLLLGSVNHLYTYTSPLSWPNLSSVIYFPVSFIDDSNSHLNLGGYIFVFMPEDFV